MKRRLNFLILLLATVAFANRSVSAQKGTSGGCKTVGTPSGFSLVTELNPVQPNGAALITTLMIGNAIRVRPVDLNGDGTPDSLAVFVTSGASGTQATYLFLLDPITGMMQTTNPISGAAWQNPMLLLSGFRATVAARDQRARSK